MGGWFSPKKEAAPAAPVQATEPASLAPEGSLASVAAKKSNVNTARLAGKTQTKMGGLLGNAGIADVARKQLLGQ